jgi:NADPH-dependent glutamate synthase beta subunit-like oxidoreductase
MNCQGYVRLIARGMDQEAAEELRLQTPFASILGRICHHPCEPACERTGMDGAVHIRALKRYLADTQVDITNRLPKIPKETGHSVAIVGAGPAGLNAAYELRCQGHTVTIFDKANQPGGLMRYGIPSFRLPSHHIDKAVELIEAMGVVFKMGQALGEHLKLPKLLNDFEAIILSIGTSSSSTLQIPGNELDGVIQGLDFLSDVKKGQQPVLGKSVIVVGGGNAAVDTALTCRRIGVGDVRIVCLENTNEMPAFAHALREIEEEQIVIENAWGPKMFSRDAEGQITIELSGCEAVFTDEGAFRPVMNNDCRLMSADAVIVAIGQKVNADGIPPELINPETRFLTSDPLTRQSHTNDKIFVSGDCSTGPSSVVDAMASGREAAISVDRFLRKDGLRWGRSLLDSGFVQEYESDHSRRKGEPRCELGKIPRGQRTVTDEVEKTFSAASARKEAERCLSCGCAFEKNRTCWICLPCEIECPNEALYVKIPYLVR